MDPDMDDDDQSLAVLTNVALASRAVSEEKLLEFKTFMRLN